MIWGSFYNSEQYNLVIINKDEIIKKGGYLTNNYIKVLEKTILTIYKLGLFFI